MKSHKQNQGTTTRRERTSGHRQVRPGADEESSEKMDNPLHEAFLEELADIYNAEKQLTKALPKMAKAAHSDELRQAFEDHLEETNQHIERLESAISDLGEKMKNKKCKGMEGLIEEGTEMIEENEGEPSLDAILISAAQKVEHYEMASYGTIAAWARQMGHNEVFELLSETLNEEKAADKKLTRIAESMANQEAEHSG